MVKKVIVNGAAALVVLLPWIALASPAPVAQAVPAQPCPDGLNPPPGAYCHFSTATIGGGWEICRDFLNWGSNCTTYIEDAPGVFRPRGY